MTSLSHAGSRGRLLPILGIGFGLAVTVGNAIGAGILRAPGEVAGHLPLVWLYMAAWVVGGLYALLGALQLAELGAMIPRSGGQYVFSRYALGEYPGFIVGWSDWISTAGTAAAVSIVIGEFSVALFPRSGASAVAIATAVVLIFAIAQWRGIRWGSAIQNVTSLLKVWLSGWKKLATCSDMGVPQRLPSVALSSTARRSPARRSSCSATGR